MVVILMVEVVVIVQQTDMCLGLFAILMKLLRYIFLPSSR
jgi:hypothetical protein